MGENLKELRRRIKSVKGTKHITSAMEMVSASKLRRNQRLLGDIGEYIKKLEEILKNISNTSHLDNNPFFKKDLNQTKSLVVIFSSDRGLCGAFNNQLIKFAEDEMEKLGKKEIELVIIGKKAITHFQKKNKYKIIKKIDNLNGKANQEVSNELVDLFVKNVLSSVIDSVYMIHFSFISKVKYSPIITKLLPLNKDITKGQKTNEYIIEPDVEGILEQLLPLYISSRFYIGMLEQFSSEHSARMMSMNNATKNCHDLIDNLTLVANKARQATITKELMDIVGGVSAIN